MALYYQIVFGILITEIVLFLGLIIPLPHSYRRPILVWISKNLIGKVQYTLKVVFAFVFILFVDSINRMMKAQERNEDSDRVADVRVDASINIKKFYNQRNMYLTGATLFLSIVLNYTYTMILELLNTEEKLKVLQQKSDSGKNAETDLEKQTEEVNKLRDQLIEANSKLVDFETLKKQADQLQVEYNRLADEHNQLSNASDSKKDA